MDADGFPALLPALVNPPAHSAGRYRHGSAPTEGTPRGTGQRCQHSSPPAAMQTGAGNEEGRLQHDPNGRAEEQYHEPSTKTHRNRGGRVSALREQNGGRGKLSQQRTRSGEAATPAPGPGPPEVSPAPAPTFPQPAAPGSRSPLTYLRECSSRSSRLPPATSAARPGEEEKEKEVAHSARPPARPTGAPAERGRRHWALPGGARAAASPPHWPRAPQLRLSPTAAQRWCRPAARGTPGRS